jgi:hypothetical protein
MVLSKIAVGGTDTGEYSKMSIRETINGFAHLNEGHISLI